MNGCEGWKPIVVPFGSAIQRRFSALSDQSGAATSYGTRPLAGVSEAVLRGLVAQGVLEPVLVDCDRPYPRALADHAPPVLSASSASRSAGNRA